MSEWVILPIEPAPCHGTKCPVCGTGYMITIEVSGVRVLCCARYPACSHADWVLDNDACPRCRRQTMRTARVRKDGPNKGRLFRACTSAACKYLVFVEARKDRPHAER